MNHPMMRVILRLKLLIKDNELINQIFINDANQFGLKEPKYQLNLRHQKLKISIISVKEEGCFCNTDYSMLCNSDNDNDVFYYPHKFETRILMV